MPAESLDFILRTLIKRSKRLDDSDIITNKLTDSLVEGFVIKQQVAIRTSIGQLQKMFLFDGVEQDHKIHIESRGTGQEVIVDLGEMGAGVEEADIEMTAEITRVPDANLPQELVYNAMDVDNDYWQHAERSQRQVVAFEDRNSVILSVVTTADQLASAVRRGHVTIWIERDRYKMTLSRRFSGLTVGSIIIFEKKGITHRFRINEISYSPEGLIEIAGHREVVGQFDAVAKGSGNSARGGGKAAAAISATELFFLDMPMLRAVDDDAGYYVAVGKKSPSATWKGANVYHSLNGSFFSLEKQYTNKTPYGVLESDASGANGSTWSNRVLRIRVVSGEIFSATKSDVLQDTNVAFLLDADGTVEILQFLTVVDNLDGTFDLTGNLRGRRGTEGAMDSHTVNVPSSVAVGSVPGNTGITFTSKLLGTEGDQLHIEILTPVAGEFGIDRSIDETGKITIVITPNADENTTAEVVNILSGLASIKSLVTVTNTDGSDGSGTVITLTETALTGGVDGSQFGLITGGETQRFIRVADDIGKTRFLKAVTVGGVIDNVSSESIVATGKALFPYSPSQVTGYRDGSENITIDWVRRTRFDGGMRDLVEVPLNETSEEYEVDIMNGAAVVRSITGLSSPTTVYTSAQQITDFGSNQNPVTVRIYQISSVIGRGFKRESSI